MLKALLAAADVAGSAILPEAKKGSIRNWVHKTLRKRVTSEQMKEVVAARLKGKTLRPFQNSIGQSRARITLVEAGCGTGKTAAAYLWASHHAHGRKLFFCYPTTGTATEGFLGYVNETDVEAKLIHSRSIVDLESIAEVKDDEENDHLLRIESLKAWSPRVVICTADTVLALVRNNRRGLYNSPAILSGAFVFDELHAYDDRMFEAVCALMQALRGTSFLLMSASLPKARKNFLHSQFSDIAEIPPPHDLENIQRYKFQRLDDKDAVLQLAQKAAANGQKVLWICNTVSRAQGILKELNALGIAARTYHSRFKYVDRRRQHRKLIRWFKPHRRRVGLVAVTTQVAEMSLDLDADLLISEIAPIAALIQRLGRLNRHVTPERPGAPREAVFINPEDVLPYDEAELTLARLWLDNLINLNQPLRQSDLAEHFNKLSPSEPPHFNTLTRWLDYGWHTIPESVREPSVSVSIILPEDEKVCRQSKAEIVRRAIPMNFNSEMQNWREFKGNLIAPKGAIHYDKRTGAIWLKK